MELEYIKNTIIDNVRKMGEISKEAEKMERSAKRRKLDHLKGSSERANELNSAVDRIKEENDRTFKKLMAIEKEMHELYSTSATNILHGEKMLKSRDKKSGGAALVRMGNLQKKNADKMYQQLSKVMDELAAQDKSFSKAEKVVETVDLTTTPQVVDAYSDCSCIICLDGKADIMLIPCGHVVICSECLPDFETSDFGESCPYCKGKIAEFCK